MADSILLTRFNTTQKSATREFVPENKPRLLKLREALAKTRTVRCRRRWQRIESDGAGTRDQARGVGASDPIGVLRQPGRPESVSFDCNTRKKRGVLLRLDRALAVMG